MDNLESRGLRGGGGGAKKESNYPLFLIPYQWCGDHQLYFFYARCECDKGRRDRLIEQLRAEEKEDERWKTELSGPNLQHEIG